MWLFAGFVGKKWTIEDSFILLRGRHVHGADDEAEASIKSRRHQEMPSKKPRKAISGFRLLVQST